LACKKKLYQFRPAPFQREVQVHRTRERERADPADPESLQRSVRQLLADKISGTLVGLWLLIPEHLRLGTWDLLRGWTNQPAENVEPRLALQLVHESALCVTGIRYTRTLSQKGFEVANGLPFVASDQAIHELLDAHTVAQSEQLQRALGLIRRARGHFIGRVVAIDPHRIRSYSKRQMRRHRCGNSSAQKPQKCAQSFFALDADTHQPICLVNHSASRTASEAAAELLPLARTILPHIPEHTKAPRPLVVADGEHFTLAMIDDIVRQAGFDLLVPMPNQACYRRQWKQTPANAFVRRWAGLAIAKTRLERDADLPPIFQLVQRCGENPGNYHYKGFWCTADRDEVQDLIVEFPKRWHIEEFFHDHQALGWNRAGTLNQNVRSAQMSLALLAQAALHQLRQRVGPPVAQWQADHLAKKLLGGLDGDIRVHDDTIVVTYYNAPDVERLRPHYEGLPEKLRAEGVSPHIPWLYDFKLDFRFK
jgi:hypothetical protein